MPFFGVKSTPEIQGIKCVLTWWWFSSSELVCLAGSHVLRDGKRSESVPASCSCRLSYRSLCYLQWLQAHREASWLLFARRTGSCKFVGVTSNISQVWRLKNCLPVVLDRSYSPFMYTLRYTWFLSPLLPLTLQGIPAPIYKQTCHVSLPCGNCNLQCWAHLTACRIVLADLGRPVRMTVVGWSICKAVSLF